MLASAVLITKEKEYPQVILDSLPPFDEVLIETECSSIHKRYELALKARNELIYVQDDDCIVDVGTLHRAYDGQLTNYISEHHQKFYEGTGITLIGWGAFFPKSMINFDRYLEQYGISPLFLRETDRVFTFLNQPHKSLVTNIQHLASAVDSSRMSTQSEHYETLREISNQLINLAK